MKPSDIPVKTAAGNQELAQRKHKLTPRARSLLIVIHGTETVAELTHNLHALGDIENSLGQLAQLGLIAVREGAGATTPVSRPIAANAPDIMPPAQQAKQLLNESAVAVLGLRSFLFVLKLEHAYSPDELRAILPEYRRVVAKAKGEPFADAMVKRVEVLLAQP
jgi:hypothetical protein